jgi:hypothetical protein
LLRDRLDLIIMLPDALAQVNVRYEGVGEAFASERAEGGAAVREVEDRLDGGALVGMPIARDDRVDHHVLRHQKVIRR